MTKHLIFFTYNLPTIKSKQYTNQNSSEDIPSILFSGTATLSFFEFMKISMIVPLPLLGSKSEQIKPTTNIIAISTSFSFEFSLCLICDTQMNSYFFLNTLWLFLRFRDGERKKKKTLQNREYTETVLSPNIINYRVALPNRTINH